MSYIVFAAGTTTSLTISDDSTFDEVREAYLVKGTVTNPQEDQQATIIIYYDASGDIVYNNQQSMLPNANGEFELICPLAKDVSGKLTAYVGGTGIQNSVQHIFYVRDSSAPNVKGSVILQDGNISLVTIKLYDSTSEPISETDTPLQTTNADINGNWTFPINVEDGTYTLVISKPGATYYQINNISVVSTVLKVVAPITLLSGDVTGNGNIDSDDLIQLIDFAYYGKSASTGYHRDLNDDDMVDNFDLQILTTNYNKQSIGGN